MSGRVPLCTTEELWRGIADLWAEDPLLIFCMTDLVAMVENTYAAGRPRLVDLVESDERAHRGINTLYWSHFGIWQQASNHVIHYDYSRDHWRSYIGKAYDNHRRVQVQA
jgi:hypothetical protein